MWATPPGQIIKEHLTDGPMIKQTKHEYKRITFQILAQAPTNTELWLKTYGYAD